jgi:hypothetical protein
MSKKTETATQISRQIRGIKINPDQSKGKRVIISFRDVTDVEPTEGEETDESSAESDEYAVKSSRRPHKTFVAALRKLTPHALALLKIDLNSGEKEWSVTSVKIDGDVLLKKARLTMTLTKYYDNDGTEGYSSMEVPQVTVFGESKYADQPALAKLFQALVDKAWDFLKGESGNSEKKIQMAFTFDEVAA